MQLESDKQLGVTQADLLLKDDQATQADFNQQQTEAASQDAATKDLVKQAAATGTATATAAQAGRKAAVNLLKSTGSWTRASAQAALSGTDEAVVSWAKSDYQRSLQLDDREKILAVTSIANAKLATEAQKTLASTDPTAVEKFLSGGALQAQAEDLRVRTVSLVSDGGKAVQRDGGAALADGRVSVLAAFLSNGYAKALAEDDRVAVVVATDGGGPNVKAAGAVALAGPAWMQHEFVRKTQFTAAQKDADTDAHVSSVLSMIANAAKDAATASESAQRAYQIAADARHASDEAAHWASLAGQSAQQAKGYADDAKAKSAAADASAAAAAASAQKAKSAAATAQTANRQANYSATQATTSANQAVNSAASARASAAQAAASASAAGKDAATASQAASDAHAIAAQKRAQEQAAAAAAAAAQAKANEANHVDPVNTPANDKVTTPAPAPEKPAPGSPPKDDKQLFKDYGDFLGSVSTWSGFVAAGLMLIPGGQPFAAAVGTFSLVTGVASALYTGIGYGFSSDKFIGSVASVGLSLIGGRVVGAIEKGAAEAAKFGVKVTEKVGERLVKAGHSAVSSVVSWFSSDD
ncbi:ALF repeat-containing protein [Kitasatospora sp. NPDC001225]